MNSSFLAFWFSQTISVLGSGMTKFAVGVLLYQKTGQVSALALSILFGYLPSLLIGPFAGVVVDRFNRKRILMATALAQAAIGLGLVLTFLQPGLHPGLVYALLAVQSAVGTFQPLAELASMPLMVSKDALTRANSLLSMNEDLSQVFAPSLGGFLVASVGIQAVLLFDVLSYFVAFGALLFIHVPSHLREGEAPFLHLNAARYLSDFGQSLAYLRAQPKMLGLVGVMALLNFTSTITLPLVTPLILERTGNNAALLGLVTACSGVGAIVGGMLVLGFLKRLLSIRQVLAVDCFEALLAQLGFGLATSPGVWGVCRFLPGVAGPFASSSYQVFWQTAVPPELQGRVFAVRRMLAVALTPLALLLSGWLSTLIAGRLVHQGLSVTAARVESFQLLFVVFGLLSATVCLWFALTPTFRQFGSGWSPLPSHATGDG